MKKQFRALQAELIKIKYANIIWVTCIAFSLAPIMGAVFILIVENPDAVAKSGGLAVKAEAMHFEGNWPSYFSILTQAIGVGGVLIFGFIASWIFGREYAEGTAKDLLSLPTSRNKILNAKFIVYILWCFALTISNLCIGLIIGLILKLPVIEWHIFIQLLSDYFFTAVITICIGTPIALFALWGKGYLTPLGFVALILVFAQVIAAAGYGSYFPWAIPGLFSSGAELKATLNVTSYLILLITGILGYVTTLLYWNKADQTQ